MQHTQAAEGKLRGGANRICIHFQNMFQSIRLGEKCAAFPLLINDFLQKMKKFQQTKIFRQFIFRQRYEWDENI